MKDTLKWSYALNQWDVRMDVFVRHEDQIRGLKTISAAGFDHVELASATGRWGNIGRPEIILLNHGSHQGFKDFLARAGISGVSSIYWDMTAPAEEEGYAFHDALDSGRHSDIVEAAKVYLDFLSSIGGDTLAARPVGSAWRSGPLGDDAIKCIASLWNLVGTEAQRRDVKLAIHYDCLSGLHTVDQLRLFLDATDPDLVGLTIDTAEMTIGGIDPVLFYEENNRRVSHIHLKDTRYRDSGSEYLIPNAEIAMLRGGAGRRIERWFYELGTEGGLVDVPGFVATLRKHNFEGWVVVESDHGRLPAELTLLNSWYLQRRLGIAL
ncbi:sugar phosphate isomerase/epimerase family protein [Propionibacterium australiense]|uniref:Sugar phosphate isomerase n=1 Tax=Propionibacterium australiense TaxID=119981 RepID=A0A383SAF5_9ACTN|nr:TIM barrel protein [Propionibacterium australiense]RLP09589.1 sugar phosphate isomerase [Propionibacterium australiense]RLP12291.1 sugar phosphate isomerase [Propionibacterium australiense]SYZ34542.1 Xylose isomerase-like TIM barrel [Propionibacterium australiense]VEH89682.1 Inosose dehydratase [Propionibacterium australiense]